MKNIVSFRLKIALIISVLSGWHTFEEKSDDDEGAFDSVEAVEIGGNILFSAKYAFYRREMRFGGKLGYSASVEIKLALLQSTQIIWEWKRVVPFRLA